MTVVNVAAKVTYVTVVAKAWWKSKLVQAGALELAFGILELIQTNVLESEKAAWGMVASGVVTILLRLLTKGPVAATDKSVVVKQPPAPLGD